ncbi:MAG: hypothetical protein Q7V57_01720 [Actinomycetota bacterium]|nr:hypothetical protein [Actinomycetota bacterium]
MNIKAASADEQIRQILYPYGHRRLGRTPAAPDIRQWAESRLPAGLALGDVRIGDLLDVSEGDVLDYVNRHGFDPRSVREDDFDWIPEVFWILEDGARFHLFYSERGTIRTTGWFASRQDARREMVRELMRAAKRQLQMSVWGHPNPIPGAKD